MLTIADVSKSYGTRELFSDVSLFIARTDRLGLIGPNGAGKSTLFGLILGEEKPDTGTIEWERGADLGYLPQAGAPRHTGAAMTPSCALPAGKKTPAPATTEGGRAAASGPPPRETPPAGDE